MLLTSMSHPLERYFKYRAITFFGQPFQTVFLYSLWSVSIWAFWWHIVWPHYGNGLILGTVMVWAVPISLVTTLGISVDFFSDLTKIFQFGSCPSHIAILCRNREGSPIRKSWAITRRSSLPKHIAALYVLHRMYESRHPLYAVKIFIQRWFSLTRKWNAFCSLSLFMRLLVWMESWVHFKWKQK